MVVCLELRSCDSHRISALRAAQRVRGFAVPVVLLTTLLFLPVVGTNGVELMWLLIAPVQILMNRFVNARSSAQSSG